MPLPQTPLERNPPLGGNCGWGEDTDPAHHRLFKERLAAEANEDAGLYSTLPHMVQAKGPESPMEKLVKESMPYDDGFDMDIVDKLLYGGPAYVDQNGVGSCVGAGAASAVASKASVELLLEGDAENPFGMTVVQYDSDHQNCAVPCVDYAYGSGKMQRYWSDDQQKFTRSNVRMGDGSYCAAQIWALKTTGVLPCFAVQDASNYVFPQTKNIRPHAGNGDDFLNRHLSVGLQHRMNDSIRIRSADDLKEAITVLKQPCMICSSWGFRAQRRVDGLGAVYARSGSWAHNMTLVACVSLRGDWYVKVRNQWGSVAHTDGWHFWITLEHFDAWVRNAECQTIGELSLVPSKSFPDFPH